MASYPDAAGNPWRSVWQSLAKQGSTPPVPHPLDGKPWDARQPKTIGFDLGSGRDYAGIRIIDTQTRHKGVKLADVELRVERQQGSHTRVIVATVESHEFIFAFEEVRGTLLDDDEAEMLIRQRAIDMWLDLCGGIPRGGFEMDANGVLRVDRDLANREYVVMLGNREVARYSQGDFPVFAFDATEADIMEMVKSRAREDMKREEIFRGPATCAPEPAPVDHSQAPIRKLRKR